MSRCPTGTVYGVSQVSQAQFLAEPRRLRVSQLCPEWDTRGTAGTLGTVGTLGTDGTHGTPAALRSDDRRSRSSRRPKAPS
jgi:hypothetical protein